MGEIGDVGFDGRDGTPGEDGADGKDGRDGLKGRMGRKGQAGRGIPGAKGMAGSEGDMGAPGRDGAKGDVGRTGVCIETPEWTAWKRELQSWMSAWRNFMQNGGIEPCQDYGKAADDVDDFIEAMISWYWDLLDRNLNMYEDAFDRIDREIDEADRKCIAAQDSQRSLIERQFDQLARQLNDVMSDNKGRP